MIECLPFDNAGVVNPAVPKFNVPVPNCVVPSKNVTVPVGLPDVACTTAPIITLLELLCDGPITVMVGFVWFVVPLLTTSELVAVAVVKSAVSVGVKVTESVTVPAFGIVPAAGLYWKVPGVDAVASNCVALKAVPAVIGASAGHVIFGVALFTVNVLVAVAVVKSAVSVGVKVTESVTVPALGIVPAAGVYWKVPGVDAVASNCVALKAVPAVIGASAGHVIFGVALFTVNVLVAVAVVKSAVSVGVKVTESVTVPAFGIVPAAGVYWKVPGVDAVASNCVALKAVPAVIGARAGHVIFGVVRFAWVTTSVLVAVAVVKSAVSVGVKTAVSVTVPTAGTVPAEGVYWNVPGVDAVAFSCVALSAVPAVIGARAGHVITGALFVPPPFKVTLCVIKPGAAAFKLLSVITIDPLAVPFATGAKITSRLQVEFACKLPAAEAPELTIGHPPNASWTKRKSDGKLGLLPLSTGKLSGALPRFTI